MCAKRSTRAQVVEPRAPAGYRYLSPTFFDAALTNYPALVMPALASNGSRASERGL